jgi:ketosteroid isomerase-like protein
MSNDAQTIEAMIRGIFSDFAEHRPENIAARTHKDYTVWDVFVPDLIIGHEAQTAFREADQRQAKARGPLKLEVEAPLINVWGDFAIARYYLNFTYQPPHAICGRVRITTCLIREDGRWKTVHHHEGIVPTGVPAYAD